MSMSPPPVLDPKTGLVQLLKRLLQRQVGQRGRRVAGSAGRPGGSPDDGLQKAGQRLQQARLARGLGLRQLADETRISTPVLEALERGWRERLPEAAYLRTMLPLLEEHLLLEPGSLQDALPAESSRNRPELRGRQGLWRFQPGSIDVLNSWQGTLLYALLTLALLLALNRQQQQLAQRGLLSIEPIPAAVIPAAAPHNAGAGTKPSASPTGGTSAADPTESIPGRPGQPLAAAAVGQGPIEDLLAAFPELRPLSSAASGQLLPKLRRERFGPDLSPGQLRLRLAAPTRLSLSSRGGDSSIAELRGEMVLPVLPPFELRLEPVPTAAGAVRWNDSALVADTDRRFRYPPAARP